MTERWMHFITVLWASWPVANGALLLYYLVILLGLLLLYGNGDLRAPEFVYQGF